MQKKLVLGKKSGLVELSRASRFSRSLARLASGSFQLVSSPAPSQIILLYNKHIIYNLHNLNRKYVTVLDVFCKMCALLNAVVVWEVFRSPSTGMNSVLKSCDESNKGTYPCLYRS